MHVLKNSRKRRSQSGSLLAELPLVIWLIFFVFLFPLINLTTLGLRLCFLYAAAHNACISSARAQTYSAPQGTRPSAVQLAQTGANLVLNSFSGIHQTSLTTKIITTDVNTQAQTIVSGPLTNAPDTSNYTYQIQITFTGTADPFIPINLPTKIAGVNQPLTVTFSDAQFYENPAALVL